MPPGFLLRASTITTNITTTTHHLILKVGSVSATNVLPIPHQQLSLSLSQNLELVFWFCQLSGVAHLLLWEDGEQLKATVTALRRLLDAPETLRRRSFAGAVICVTATKSHCFPPLATALGISSLDYNFFADGLVTKVFPSSCVINCSESLKE